MSQATATFGGGRALARAVGEARKDPAGRQATVLALSRLQPEFRRRPLVHGAAALFAPLHRPDDGIQVYLAECLDIVVLGRDLPRDALRETAGRVRRLFGADPLTRESGPGRDRFARWFDLGNVDHLNAFLGVADDIDRRAGEASQATGAWNINDQPLTPQRLALLVADMDRLDIGPYLQRQPVITITEARTTKVLFEEIYVSLGPLRAAIAEEVNLTSDRWLFQDFTRSLDHHLLRVLKSTLAGRVFGSLSVNLNLDSLHGAAFDSLARALGPERPLVVEAQGVDAFADLGAMLRARDWLHARGHKLVIDGLTPRVLETVDLAPLGADYYKLIWNPGLVHSVDGDEAAAARALIGALGPGRVILCRTDSERAMTWGLRAGIRHFQGFLVDTMVTAGLHGHCPERDTCPLTRCVAIRRAVQGGLLENCPQAALLDSLVLEAEPAP
ncbi:EAL domain-containing protein [Pararhodospirillum oryzae]|uniref:Diguanylate phosphodiesterase n=1 Tax=Pararhodospirillum oryzae TaxID=478448 RepID=A0A512H7Z4_9PROT|nr:EAL domain-containing protein [Pararhodospirillum oryzae]GEO81561.1 diguanylate phosphodiesterase [Pararhodospirillum oryzae]